MLGLMQDWSLLIHRIIDHAAIQHGSREIVSRGTEGMIRRSDYARTRRRALGIAQQLARDGIRLGDRVGTLAWTDISNCGTASPASVRSTTRSIPACSRIRSPGSSTTPAIG